MRLFHIKFRHFIQVMFILFKITHIKMTAYPFRSSDFLVHLDNDKSRTISERFSRIP